MKNNNNYEYLLKKISTLKGVGKKTTEILKKKGITNIFDLLWRLPISYTDRTKILKINELQVGQISTIKIIPIILPRTLCPYSHQKIYLNSDSVIFTFLI